jgi:NTF2 fold immunity protein of polymorphic toxin system component
MKKGRNVMKMVKILPLALMFCCSVMSQQAVNNSAEAIKIAEKALTRIYGKRQTESERPFKAKLEDGVWTISGTLHCKDAKGKPAEVCVGGVAVARISAADGRVISTQHTK